MIEAIIKVWESLPFILQFPIGFWFTVIFMRGVVAQDITTFMEDKGIIRRRKQSYIYKSLDIVYNLLGGLVPNRARYLAIWQHYRRHETDSEFDCMEGRCAEFNATSPQEPAGRVSASAL